MVRAGRLRKWVQIEETDNGVDATGGEVDTWSKVWDRRAGIEPVSGSELVEADAIRTVGTVKVIMRWWDGLTTNHRIKYGTRVNESGEKVPRIFEINHINNVNERNKDYEVLCTEVIND